MKTIFRNLILPICLIVLLLFIILVVNQTILFVGFVSTINPMLGQFTLYFLLTLYLVLVLIPLIIYLKMPPILVPPEDEESPEYEKYLEKLSKRLAKNPIIKERNLSLESKDHLESALAQLDEKAVEEIVNIASIVFVSTAISQSGRLDGIMVLMLQSRLVWRVSRIYLQRPSPRELLRLYTNVATTTFLVNEIEEHEIFEQLSSVITASLPASFTDLMPGFKSMSNIITSSIQEGSANAFLTLRVGVVSKNYFSIHSIDKSKRRKNATVEALTLLGPIIKNLSGNVLKIVGHQVKNIGNKVLSFSKNTAESMVDVAESAFQIAGDGISSGTKYAVDSSKKAMDITGGGIRTALVSTAKATGFINDKDEKVSESDNVSESKPASLFSRIIKKKIKS